MAFDLADVPAARRYGEFSVRVRLCVANDASDRGEEAAAVVVEAVEWAADDSPWLLAGAGVVLALAASGSVFAAVLVARRVKSRRRSA